MSKKEFPYAELAIVLSCLSIIINIIVILKKLCLL